MAFNQEVADELAEIMQDLPEAKASKMFGMPGYKVNGKLGRRHVRGSGGRQSWGRNGRRR